MPVLTAGSGGSDDSEESGVPDFDDPWGVTGEDCGVRVAVGDGDRGFTYIPTLSVTYRQRPDGPLTRNHLCEVHIPAEWQGMSVIEHIQAYGNDPSEYDQACIELQDDTTGDMMACMRGFARGIGASAHATDAQKLFVQGPEAFLSLAVSETFQAGTTAKDVLEGAAGLLTENTVFDITAVQVGEADVELVTQEASTAPAQRRAATIDVDLSSFDIDVDVPTQKTFKRNRHSLMDVLDWLREAVGGSVYFDTDEEFNIRLVWEPDTVQNEFVGQEVDSDGIPVTVLDNDALQEAAPTSTVEVWGSSASWRHGFGIIKGDSSQFPKAVASYPPLVKRMGGPIAPPPREVDAVTMDAAKAAAKSQLVDLLSSRSLGDMTLRLKPDITLRDKITALPVCEGRVQSDVAPLSYQVESVTHTKEGGKSGKTKVHCSIFVDESLIETRATTEDTSSEETDAGLDTPTFTLPTGTPLDLLDQVD